MNQSSGIFPKFKIEPIQHIAKSEAEGRPVFVDREIVEIHIAGDAKSVVVRRVQESDKQRWPEQYEAFKKGLDQPLEGTPLNEWGSLPASRAAELKAMKIYTVEALADLDDNKIKNIGMGGRALVEKAKAFLDVSADQAVAERYAAENVKLKDDIEMLKQQMADLSKQVDKQRKPKAA